MQNYMQDNQFLEALSKYKIKIKYVKLEVLDANETPIGSIEGICTGGSINVNNSSAMRRTANLSLIANEGEGIDLKDIDSLLAINKKIKVYIGIDNKINSNYDDIIWFKEGVFVICDPTITHAQQGIQVNLSLKDKMCLLNGEYGGGLPASIIFDTYDQYDENGKLTKIENPIYDIIYTLVNNYGGIPLDKIFINDVSRRLKQLCRYNGAADLFYNTENDIYTFQKPLNWNDNGSNTPSVWRKFTAGDDIGYRYVDFVYPSGKDGLVSGIGDNICNVLNKIIEKCGNYEYFFDVDGNFIWQEKRNYLNNSYNPVKFTDNNSYIIGDLDYFVDFSNNTHSLYTFMQGDNLITSYSNTIGYSIIKNDYHIWGQIDKSQAFHYHIAVREKPTKLVTKDGVDYYNEWDVVYEVNDKGKSTGKIRLLTPDEDQIENKDTIPYYIKYFTTDWRAEIYLRGLEKIKHNEIRPDRFEQELLDLFDDIYNMKDHIYKEQDLKNSKIKYFIDYLEPYNHFIDYSVDNIGIKTMSYQNNGIVRMYNTPDVPNVIMICDGHEDYPIHEDEKYRAVSPTDGAMVLEKRCSDEGQPYTHITASLLSKIIENTLGYSADEVARDLLYQHTNYAEQINLSTIPVYHLEPNNIITVIDKDSDITGDYVIDSLSIPLDTSLMQITATKCLKRI